LCFNLNHLHVEDAIDGLEQIRKKPAEWLKNIIKTGIRSAVSNHGMNEDRLYIKEVLLGKNKYVKGIRIHAKGRMGMMKRHRTQVTVILEEKRPEDVYRTIMMGKVSPGVAGILRAMLMDKNAGYQDIRKIQNYLTAKGRQQQKLMFKRKVENIIKDKKEMGLVLDKDYVTDMVLEEEGKKFAGDYWAFKRTEAEQKIAERQEVFNKNIKAR
jgi:hypothetical protein